MDRKLPEENMIRRYLLGVLQEPELSEIEEKLLSSEELSQTADLIEDEIIEQYLDGELDDRDKRAVETHFLRPPAHQKKLHFARLLRHHFAQSPATAQPVPDRIQPHPVPVPRYRFSWTYGGAAAAVLLGVTSLYLGVVHFNLKRQVADGQKTQAALQAELAQQRTRTATLEEKLQALQTSSLTSLNLRPGVVRSIGGVVPKVTIHPATQFIRVDLIVQNGSLAPFRVRLVDSKGDEVLSQTGLRPIPTPDPSMSRLVFDMPSRGIRSGAYALVVSSESKPGGAVTYPFDID